MENPPYLRQLTENFKSFPGVGEKSARRMAFYLLQQSAPWVENFAHVLLCAKKAVHSCTTCGMLTEASPCSICADYARNAKIICVVETAEDGLSMEQAGHFDGKYHVLGGKESPLEGSKVPKDSIERLRTRIKNCGVQELIMATNPRVEGDLTAYAVCEAMSDFGDLKISRLACGLAVGSSIGYADKVTLHIAMMSRRPFGDGM